MSKALISVGIDLGEKENGVAVVADDGVVMVEVAYVKFANEAESIVKIEAFINGHTEGRARPYITVESERHHLTQVLLHRGWTVYLVNPRNTKTYRDVVFPGTDKNDRRDSVSLGHAPAIARGALRKAEPMPGYQIQVAAAARRRQKSLRWSKTSANIARSEIAKYWPSMAAELGSAGLRAKPWWVDILIAFPTPARFAAASPDDFREVLISAGRKWRLDYTISHTILPLQSKCETDLPDYMQDAFAEGLISALNMLQASEDNLLMAEESQAEALAAHPYGELFLSLPGVSTTIAAALAAGIGNDATAFETPESLAVFAGCRPQTRSSGKGTYIGRRMNKNVLLHWAIREWASQITQDRDRTKKSDTGPLVYGPGARWVRDRAQARYLDRLQIHEQDAKVRKAKAARSFNHALRLTGERLCVGLWYALNPEDDGVVWEEFDEPRTFRAAYIQMAAAEKTNATLPETLRTSIPGQAPLPKSALKAHVGRDDHLDTDLGSDPADAA
jgi:transposase